MHVAPPPDFQELLSGLQSEDFTRVLVGASINEGRYDHWDKLRHRPPPDGLTHEQWWLRQKIARKSAARPLPLTDPDGEPFTFVLTDDLLGALHFVDQRCGGEIAMEEVVTADDQVRHRWLVNSLMEEAIRSSQLEGAATSRPVAKEMLQTGRQPVDRSERMILNNYRAMLFMRDSVGQKLTPEAVLELHRVITEGTLDRPDAAGRLQLSNEERVAVLDRDGGQVLHVPPPAEHLPDRLKQLCAFANETPEGRFIHPVIHALVLHFWLAYDHPFEDGNGRTARALFYWSMRKQGYWLAEYLSISRILRQAPAKYSRSFVYAETDEGDLTYFLRYQLDVIRRAVRELHEYLQRKVAEVKEVETLLRQESDLNYRQLALLGHALRNAGSTYTIGVHASMHGVTHETARADLQELTRRGLLIRNTAGRQYRFSAPPDLVERLRHSSAQAVA